MGNLSVILWVWLVTIVVVVVGEDVVQTLEKRIGYSKFADLLKNSSNNHQIIKAYLDNSVTVFAPHNDAFDKYDGKLDENLVLNHIVNTAVSREDMRDQEKLSSLMNGHPPIWIRLMGRSLFVNQAKVKIVAPCKSKDGNQQQYLYLIDSVLAPVISLDDNLDNLVNVRAGNLLANRDKYDLGNFTINKFSERINQMGLDNFPELNQDGKYTFFIPIDSAFEVLQPGTIDIDVVRSHIVPNYLLFDKPRRRRTEAKPTLQYNEIRGSLDLKVMVKVFEKDDVDVVQSQTVTGTKHHKRGRVTAEIVKANIPVQNGIVHLISKPLVVMASTLWEHLDPDNPDNRRFKEFAEYVSNSSDLSSKLNSNKQRTIFIPTNQAFNNLDVGSLSEGSELDRVLGLHVLEEIVQWDDIRILKPQNKNTRMFSLPSIDLPTAKAGTVYMWEEDGTYYVDGGGVRAEVVEANVGASNGVIHSINRVLGVPLDTVYDKMSTDPVMRKTFKLGQMEDFNSDLSRLDLQFTYFVPTDSAWAKIQKEYHSAYKVLFMEDFYRQAHKVLERHLKIGSKLSIDELLNNTKLDAKRGGVPLTITKVDDEVMVSKGNIMARVVRGDVECTNGYIHLIDKVIMKERDVTLGRSKNILPSICAIITTWIISLLL